MVKILNGEVVQDDDPRLKQTPASAAGPAGAHRDVGPVKHDTTTVVDGEEEGGFMQDLGEQVGVDLGRYLGENSQPVFSTPAVPLAAGYEIPAIDFTAYVIFVIALSYALAGPRGLLAVTFIYLLTQLSAGNGGAINEAVGLGGAAPAGPAGATAAGAASLADIRGAASAPAPAPAGFGGGGSALGGGGGGGQRLGASGGGAGQSRLLREMHAAQD